MPHSSFVRQRRAAGHLQRDGFARACPLRHPARPVLALRDRSGLTRVFLVVFTGAFNGRGRRTGRPDAAGAGRRAWCPGDRLASRVPWSGVYVGKSLPGHRSRRRRTSDRASARPNAVALPVSRCARESRASRISRVVPEYPGSKRSWPSHVWPPRSCTSRREGCVATLAAAGNLKRS